MMADAPGAFGSAVIFNSSGLTGWNPTLAVANRGNKSVKTHAVRNATTRIAPSEPLRFRDTVRPSRDEQNLLSGLWEEEKMEGREPEHFPRQSYRGRR